MYCQERQTGQADAQIKTLVEKKEPTEITASDTYMPMIRWGFTVKQAKVVTDTLHLIPPRCASQTVSSSVLSHSVELRMENPRNSM